MVDFTQGRGVPNRPRPSASAGTEVSAARDVDNTRFGSGVGAGFRTHSVVGPF